MFKLAIADVNADNTTLPLTTLNFSAYDSKGQELQAIAGTQALVGQQVFGIVGPSYSRETEGPAMLASSLQVPMVSPGSTAVSIADKTRYPFLLRSVGSDASLLSSMIDLANTFGWKRLAAIASSDLASGASSLLQPLLDNFGYRSLLLSFATPTTSDLQDRLQSTLQLIASEGYRIIIAYPLTAAAQPLLNVVTQFGMCQAKYVWLARAYSSIGPWSTCPQALAFLVDSTPTSTLQATFPSRWASVSRQWNASMDGWFDPTTKTPFFHPLYSPTVWDTADRSSVGDGLPEMWGTYVYDTVWMFAVAAHTLLGQGGDPQNGTQLRQALLSTSFAGVSGIVSFAMPFQDRVVPLKVFLIMPTGSYSVASSNASCSLNCLTFAPPGQSAIPWLSGLGLPPGDGRELDSTQSRASASSTFNTGEDVVVTFFARDSFGQIPCSSECKISSTCSACLALFFNFSALYLKVTDVATGQTVRTAGRLNITYQATAGLAQVTLLGGLFRDSPEDKLVLLQVGYQDTVVNGTMSVTITSLACKAGEALDAKQRSCTACLAGTFSAMRGATACTMCPAGTSQPGTGASMCQPCEVGKYSKAGQAECTACDVGTYADGIGLTSCKRCGDGKASQQLFATMTWVTLQGKGALVPVAGASNVSLCGCSAGTWPDPHSGECHPCIEGLVCLGMDQTFLKPGYFTSASNPSVVFKCRSPDGRCPGGALGTCAPGRDNTTLACTDCFPGHFQTSSGACSSCGPADFLPAFLIGGAVFACVCIVYHNSVMEDMSKAPSPIANVAIILGQLLGLLQQIGVLSKVQLMWPEPLASILAVARVVQFDPEIVRSGCLVRLTTELRFSLMAFGIFGVLAVLVMVHLIVVTIVRWRKLELNISGRTLMSGAGTLLLAFFISITSNMVSPLRCNSNPSGMWTVQTYPNVICGSKQHWTLVAIGVAAALFPAGLLAATLWLLIYRVPAMILDGNGHGLHRYGFLFARFRTGSFHYAAVLLSRNMILAILPVVPEEGIVLMLIVLTLLVSFAIATDLRPWRMDSMNNLDIVSSGLMILLMVTSSQLLESRPNVLSLTAFLYSIVAAVSLAALMMILKIIFNLLSRRRKPFKYFLCHHKAGAGSFARLLKMKLEEAKSVRAFLDSDDLVDAAKLFDYVGTESERFVILASPDILTRKWCVGEMVTAHSNNVPTVLVTLPGFNLPDDNFIQHYDSHVPEISALAAHGISLEMVQETLRWLHTSRQVALPNLLSASSLDSFLPQLRSSRAGLLGTESRLGRTATQNMLASFSLSALGGSLKLPELKSNLAIVVQQSNFEAAAAAQILQKLLAPMLMHLPRSYPTILPEGENGLPSDVETVLLLFTSGCMHDVSFSSRVALAANRQLKRMLVISEEGFRFPEEELLHSAGMQMASAFAGIFDDPSVAAENYMQAVRSTFSDIAIVFNPQSLSSTKEVLQAKAKQIADRLLNGKLNRFSVAPSSEEESPLSL